MGAMCVDTVLAHSSTRFSLGADNTDEDIDIVLEVLPPIVQRLREMSPLYNLKEPITCKTCEVIRKLI